MTETPHPSEDRDLTGQDPMSSAAEGDADPGSAALSADAPDDAGQDDQDDQDVPSFSQAGPPPEAADDTPVTDAVPDSPGTEPR